MKVHIYSQWQKMIEKSGVGRAIYHQKQSLALQNILCTDNKVEADLIHINTIFPGSIRVAKWAKRKGKAVVFHAHSTKEDFKDSYIGSNFFATAFCKWIKRCYELGDCIITPSEYSKKLLESYGIKKPIYVMSNGIDMDFYQKREKDREDFRKQYGYSDKDKVIMSVGLWIKRKGLLDFVKLAERNPGYKFIWFGESDLRTIPNEIKEAVLSKTENLLFAGYVDRDKLRQAYSSCDLFLFPSHEETEGIVVLEALAMKIPVLLRDIPVYDDWLVKGKDVYKAGSLEEFEIIAKNIIENKVPNITEEGYKVANMRSLLSVGKQLSNIYKGVVKKDFEIV